MANPAEITGTVKDGKIVLPDSVRLPEGARVRIIVTEQVRDASLPPVEKEELHWVDVEHDLRIAQKLRFSK